MKKILSFVLALTMLFALSVTAFADDTLTEVGDKDIVVKATVTEGSDGANNTVHKYSINLTWTTTNGSYRLAGSSGTTYTWDPATKTYTTSSGSAGDSYSETTTPNVSVTVTNYSDVAVKASADYAAADSNGSTWAGVNTTGVTLATAVTGDPSTDGITNYASATGWGTTTFAGDVTYTATTSGTDITLGTVTITIAAA